MVMSKCQCCVAWQTRPVLAHRRRSRSGVGRLQNESISPQERGLEKRKMLNRFCLRAAAGQPELSAEEKFVLWLVNNGVEGLGKEESKLGLFEREGGYRGIASIKSISKGEAVLRVPLQMAILDTEDDFKNAYEGAPWNVRLACKLLRLKHQGIDSPWYPFLEVLPRCVPGVLQTFQWEDIRDIEYPDMADKVAYDNWLIVDSWQRLTPEAMGGATREEFEWAMSIVHSRSFAALQQKDTMTIFASNLEDKLWHNPIAAIGAGGLSARMLIPCIDMMNHGGNQAKGLFSSDCEAVDKVRWEYEEESDAGPAEIVVYACSDIPDGIEVLMSYGERSNDDFFLHYGFVPPQNPRDEVVLFTSLENAIEWFCRTFQMEGENTFTEDLKKEAMDAGLKEDINSYDPKLSNKSGEALEEENNKLRVMAGSLVDGRLLAVFGVLGREIGVSERSSITQKCWEMLDQMKPFLQDLEVLGASDVLFKDYLAFYSEAIDRYQVAVGQLPGNEDTTEVNGKMSFERRLTYVYRAYKKMILWDVLLGLAKA